MDTTHDLIFALSSHVRLRREAFGGIAFHCGTGRLIELDKEAFEVLVLLQQLGYLGLRLLAKGLQEILPYQVPIPKIAHLLKSLEYRGIIKTTTDLDASSKICTELITSDIAMIQNDNISLSAPITAHWAITYNCGLRCYYCYNSPSTAFPEMTREEKLQSVHHLADWGVFEVAIGGGEPTLSSDLISIIDTIRSRGMVVTLTTNGQIIDEQMIKLIAKACNFSMVSLDRPDILNAYRGIGVFSQALSTIKLLQDAGAHVGVNLLVVPENIETIDKSLEFIEAQEIERVVLLYPFGNCDSRWSDNWHGPAEWQRLRGLLTTWCTSKPSVTLELSCGLSFLLDHLTDEERRYRLIYGCTAGRRFISIRPDGMVFPCSHLSHNQFALGHLLHNNVHTIWQKNREIIKSINSTLTDDSLGHLSCPATNITSLHAVKT